MTNQGKTPPLPRRQRQRVLTHKGGEAVTVGDTAPPTPEVSPRLAGASDLREADVQGGSLLDSEEVDAPDGVLARPVFPPGLGCSAPGLPEEDKVSEVWPVCGRVLVNASEEVQAGAVGPREEALGPAGVGRPEGAELWLTEGDVWTGELISPAADELDHEVAELVPASSPVPMEGGVPGRDGSDLMPTSPEAKGEADPFSGDMSLSLGKNKV